MAHTNWKIGIHRSIQVQMYKQWNILERQRKMRPSIYGQDVFCEKRTKSAKHDSTMLKVWKYDSDSTTIRWRSTTLRWR
jgi:hypothetical protein